MIVPEPAPRSVATGIAAWGSNWLASLPAEPRSATVSARMTGISTRRPRRLRRCLHAEAGIRNRRRDAVCRSRCVCVRTHSRIARAGRRVARRCRRAVHAIGSDADPARPGTRTDRRVPMERREQRASRLGRRRSARARSAGRSRGRRRRRPQDPRRVRQRHRVRRNRAFGADRERADRQPEILGTLGVRSRRASARQSELRGIRHRGHDRHPGRSKRDDHADRHGQRRRRDRAGQRVAGGFHRTESDASRVDGAQRDARLSRRIPDRIERRPRPDAWRVRTRHWPAESTS